MLLTSPGQCLAWADWLSSQAVYITKRQRWPHLFKLVALSSCCYFPFVFLGSKSDNRMEFRGAAQRFHQVLPGQTWPSITCPYFSDAYIEQIHWRQSLHPLPRVTTGAANMEIRWRFLKNLGSYLPEGPAPPPLDMRPKDFRRILLSRHVVFHLCAALFTIVRNWNQSTCLSTNEWIIKLRSIIFIMCSTNTYIHIWV